ncbi:C1q-like domain-containing protein [Paenibacillus sp. YN15]|uniref:C1q-like domain-containing protein n=1 Tax=Paenibacillus sp. YN15 TaxID=1742774 RepID=UPI000DCAF703|nr:hypothetical protein [Paenibacillus sp. YN15]RAU93216.1 hypothetical protein DQG13_26185 [Paenibacillus sp. YN15]
MPKYTPNLNIQLADPATDGNQTFNIETMINDPVEKLDEALGLVPVSGDVRAATTGNIVLSGAQTIDGIALAAGNRVLVKNQTAGKENGIYTVSAGAWTRTADADTTAKLAAGVSVYVEEGTANGKSRWQMANTGAVILGTTALLFEKTGGPGSATDTVIGSRTVSDATAPTGDSGTVTTLFGWLANMVKAITGGATWRTLPTMSIAAIKAVLDAATNAATANTLMKRDANGRAQVAAPAAAGDIARKDTVDGAIGAHKAEADPHGQYVKKAGDTMVGSLVVPGMEIQNSAPIMVWTETDSSNKKWYAVADGGVFSIRENTLGASVMEFQAGGDVRVKNGSMGLAATTVSDITYFVRTDGNDNNSGTANTAAGAFKTIGKAISMIPQVVNHNVAINVGAGTYTDEIFLPGRVGSGGVWFHGESNTTTICPGVHIMACGCLVEIEKFKFTRSNFHAVWLRWNSRVFVDNCTMTEATSGYCGVLVEAGTASIINCTISNKGVAIQAMSSAFIGTWNNSGTGNDESYTARDGASCITIGGTTRINGNLWTTSGGMILPDAGVINPWGDNTWNTRTAVRANRANNLSLTSGINTKVVFETENYDTLGEYDPATGRFTAQKQGLYLVSFSLRINKSVKDYLVGKVYVNGAVSTVPYQQYSNEGINHASGAIILALNAGDYVEIYVAAFGGTNTLETSVDGSYVLIRAI